MKLSIQCTHVLGGLDLRVSPIEATVFYILNITFHARITHHKLRKHKIQSKALQYLTTTKKKTEQRSLSPSETIKYEMYQS